VLFAWIALAFTSALGGLWSTLRGGGLELGLGGSLPVPGLRTALLMPTYNEDPARVMAGLQATYESLAATGHAGAFDLFILSDTTDPDVWIAEEAAFLALRERTGAAGRIFYRRRPKNSERKAGNIADWVRRWGAAYPVMLVLDADSVMEGETLVRLACAMERNPGVGILQTLPVIVGATTLFARMQQFAGRVYGPLIAQGIAWWHGSEGNYWGHNAAMHTAAFAAAAGLPTLPGRTPFGGHILSHDFVEAALIRRAGWAVHMAPGLGGSYEEGPPSLTDVAVRDRRWCQGNLQHAKVLLARGLHPVSRLHLLMGIGSYITSPLWLLFLLAGVLISLQSRFVRPEYFGEGRALFPSWPQVDPVLAAQVFAGTMAVLLAPKLLAYLTLLRDGALRRGCGGGVRTGLGVLVETLLGGLIAPVAMLIHTGAVAGILLGRDSGWNPQRRDDGRVPLRQVVAGYWRLTLFGLLLAGAVWTVSQALFLWMLPVLLGLGLAIPLVALTSSRTAGQALRRLGLLGTLEERQAPAVLLRAAALSRELRRPAEPAIPRLLRDSALLARHRDMLPPPRRRGEGAVDPALAVGLAKIADADTVAQAAASLSRAEAAAVLGSAEGLHALESLAG
jgi:membrane glycosyltransferase